METRIVTWSKVFFYVVLVCILSGLGWCSIDGKKLTIGGSSSGSSAPPYFYGTFDAAGFSDWIWYGYSPEHPHGYHELLSGEWGAAIYYDGIATDWVDPSSTALGRKAMWLTQAFEYPNWDTKSTFFVSGDCRAWDDPNNPLTGMMDTGISFIQNGTVEVRIDYEVVDLAFRDPNIYAGTSPMTYIDPDTQQIMYVNSDRYCFLQTYTIRNIDPNQDPITNLAFYQFHHSHGANDYTAAVNSTYESVLLPDPLEDYQPINPRHQAGNFRYDITQWNSPEYRSTDHTDFVNFSSIRQPDWIDQSVYHGHSGKPSAGGHINIERRQLNNQPSIYLNEVAGAMGWNLGTLDPNETTSITIAYMFGKLNEPEIALVLTKQDNLESGCVSPGDPITYTIQWENQSTQWVTDVALVDYLPVGASYPVSQIFDPATMTFYSSDPNYDEEYHTYTWVLDDIAPMSSGSQQLTVYVNDKSQPGLPLHNQAKLTSSLGVSRAEEYTPVCCWGGDVIYVDQRATGNNNGTSWKNAYTDLQAALIRAAAGCATEVRVAYGTYDPGRAADTTFAIPDGVCVYGGYRGGSFNPNDRNPKRYATILSGSSDSDERNETIVTMGDGSLLDGFTITDAAEYGVYGTGADFTIEKCIVENSDGYGIYSADGNVTVKWCKIYGSQFDGVYHRGSHYTLTVENSWIMRNGVYGIYCINSTPTVKNSIISESNLSEIGYEGICIVNPTYSPVLYNNTIANNKAEGIFFTDNANASNDPNFKDYPDVQNCIVYYNNNGGPQFAGVNPDLVANFCCIQDCNTVNTNNFDDEPGFAYTVDPNGIPDPNNYHLSAGSFCIDRGNPDPAMGYASQVDYDNEARQYGDRVDVGADEVYNCDDEYLSQADVYNALDWNADGIVNLVEFNEFSAAWLSHNPKDPLWLANPNLVDPNAAAAWNPMCNLDSTGSSTHTIDTADLTVFLNDWLWVACWKLEEINAAAAQAESMSAQSISSARSLSVYFLDSYLESAKNQPEVSAATLIQILEFLNSAAAEESDNAAGIEDIKAILLAELQGLQSTENQ
jgi:uncharacterized repeat protein (TIGR01451 family)